MDFTPNLNTPARVIYALLGLGLIVWAGLSGFTGVKMLALLAFGVILIAEAGSGW